MGILLDSALAFLSCVGLWTLGKMVFGYLFINKDCYEEDYFLKEDTSGWTQRRITMK